MASTIGKGGSATATTAEAVVYDPTGIVVTADGSGCTVYVLRNIDTTNTLLVRYPKLQGAANWVPVPPGGVHYIVDKKGVDIIYAKSNTGETAYTGGPVGCEG